MGMVYYSNLDFYPGVAKCIRFSGQGVYQLMSLHSYLQFLHYQNAMATANFIEFTNIRQLQCHLSAYLLGRVDEILRE